jgi:hypothetical protein
MDEPQNTATTSSTTTTTTTTATPSFDASSQSYFGVGNQSDWYCEYNNNY